METDIEAKTGSDWPEVLRSLEATLRRLSDRVLELNEQTHANDPDRWDESPSDEAADELERIDSVEARWR